MICCTICGIDKPESMFYGRHRQCKRCMNQKQTRYWREKGDNLRREQRAEAERSEKNGPIEPRPGTCRICAKAANAEQGELVQTPRGPMHADCWQWHESARVVHRPSVWRSSAAMMMECA